MVIRFTLFGLIVLLIGILEGAWISAPRNSPANATFLFALTPAANLKLNFSPLKAGRITQSNFAGRLFRILSR